MRQRRARHTEAHKHYKEWLIKQYVPEHKLDDLPPKNTGSFLCRYKETRNKFLDYSKYNDVLNDILDNMMDLMIYDGMLIDIPYLGTLGVVGSRKKPRLDKNGKLIVYNKINKYATFNLWKKEPELKGKKYIYYMNEQTNGFTYRTHWFKSASLRNHKFYKLKTSKYFKKCLHEWILSPNREFDYYKLKDV